MILSLCLWVGARRPCLIPIAQVVFSILPLQRIALLDEPERGDEAGQSDESNHPEEWTQDVFLVQKLGGVIDSTNRPPLTRFLLLSAWISPPGDKRREDWARESHPDGSGAGWVLARFRIVRPTVKPSSAAKPPAVSDGCFPQNLRDLLDTPTNVQQIRSLPPGPSIPPPLRRRGCSEALGTAPELSARSFRWCAPLPPGFFRRLDQRLSKAQGVGMDLQ